MLDGTFFYNAPLVSSTREITGQFYKDIEIELTVNPLDTFQVTTSTNNEDTVIVTHNDAYIVGETADVQFQCELGYYVSAIYLDDKPVAVDPYNHVGGLEFTVFGNHHVRLETTKVTPDTYSATLNANISEGLEFGLYAKMPEENEVLGDEMSSYQFGENVYITCFAESGYRITDSTITYYYPDGSVITTDTLEEYGNGIESVRYGDIVYDVTVEEIPDTPTDNTGDTTSPADNSGSTTQPPATNPTPPPTSGGSYIPPTLIEDEDLVQASPMFIFKPAINGYEDQSFKPEGLITRAEAATMFTRILDLEAFDQASFDDVDELHWAIKNIGCMEKAELIKGYDDGSYKPNNHITKAEFATIISRVMKLASLEIPTDVEQIYTDIEAHWATEAIESLYSYGIYIERDGTTFAPNQKITRAEAIVLLNLLMNRELTPADYVTPTYIDVAKDYWAYDHIEAASK